MFPTLLLDTVVWPSAISYYYTDSRECSSLIVWILFLLIFLYFISLTMYYQSIKMCFIYSSALDLSTTDIEEMPRIFSLAPQHAVLPLNTQICHTLSIIPNKHIIIAYRYNYMHVSELTNFP